MEKNKDPSKETIDQSDLNKRLKEEAEKAVHHKIKDLVHQKGTFIERSGFKLALIVLILMGTIALALLGYKFFSNVTNDEVLQLAEVFISRTLLPVLTLILGYIFGSREGLSRDQ